MGGFTPSRLRPESLNLSPLRGCGLGRGESAKGRKDEKEEEGRERKKGKKRKREEKGVKKEKEEKKKREER